MKAKINDTVDYNPVCDPRFSQSSRFLDVGTKHIFQFEISLVKQLGI